jgi:AraC-like DNA-binding protein
MLLWRASNPLSGEAFEAARSRPPGVVLVVILPGQDAAPQAADFLRIIELCRPHSVLPHHVQPNPLDLQSLLRRPPEDFASEVMDYLAWRGIVLDQDTRHVVRRTLELSSDVRTVSALSRSLYLSRRALGRRFLERGIPVPSHWLHLGRVLRACIQLQNINANLFDVASDLSYADGFALSNQMSRLLGVRPSVAREYLGWEWILEAWLRREAETGGFSREYASLITLDAPRIAVPREPKGARVAAGASRSDLEPIGARPRER